MIIQENFASLQRYVLVIKKIPELVVMEIYYRSFKLKLGMEAKGRKMVIFSMK